MYIRAGLNAYAMEDFDEDLIWDSLMESAKTKIDYDAFAALFPFPANNFLSSVIYGYAMRKDADAITANIVSQTVMTGNFVHRNQLHSMVDRMRQEIGLEIQLTSDALGKLARGDDPEEIYRDIAAVLNAGGQ